MKKIYLLLLLFYIVVALNYAQEKINDELNVKTKEKIENFFNDNSDKGFNGAVLVYKENDFKFTLYKGFENKNSKININRHTLFHLASASKQFYALAIVKLHEEAKLEYDDYVCKYIPEFPYKNITIRHLLNHTSGLPNYMTYFEKEWLDDNNPTNVDVLNWFIKKKPKLLFQPNQSFSYSNTGYVVLALLIERISKQKVEKYLEEKVFKPANMNRTFIYNIRNKKYNYDINKGFARNKNGYRLINFDVNDGTTGDKGIYSSIVDLYYWSKALDNQSIVSLFSLKHTNKKSITDNENELNYGFGYRLKEFGSDKIIYHYGKWSGFRCYFAKNIERRITIIILNNTSHSIKWIVDGIESILYPDYFVDSNNTED